MKKDEIILYQVFLSAKLSPDKVTMDVFKARAIERGNSYLITARELSAGKMENLTHNKVITKANIMVVSGYTNSDNACRGTWCFEEQISEAKELCMEEMHSALKRNLDNATRMSTMFQAYQHESK